MENKTPQRKARREPLTEEQRAELNNKIAIAHLRLAIRNANICLARLADKGQP